MPKFTKVRAPQNSAFNLDRARELLDLVSHAHAEFARAVDKETRHQPWQWDNDTTPITLNGVTYTVIKRFGFAGYFYALHNPIGRKRVPFGFIAHTHTAVYVVFRGTMEPAEWVSNAKALQEPFLENEALGDVHRGFQRTYTREDRGEGGMLNFDPNDNLPSMRDVIETELNRHHVLQGKPLFVTGHSLGGALATLATAHIKKFTPFTRPTLYSFASPRVGDPEFARLFDDLDCFRIANSEDRVINLPVPASFVSLLSQMEQHQPQNLIGQLIQDQTTWEHIGEPLYFTAQKGKIPDNHTIPVYQEALR